MSTIRKTPSHRVDKKIPIVRRLNRFFAARPRRSASPVRRWSNRQSRSTDRGISKGGEPSKPTPSRTLPSRGTITFVPRRTMSRPAAGRVVDVVANEVAGADRSQRHAERGARDLVIEDVQNVCDHSAGADV